MCVALHGGVPGGRSAGDVADVEAHGVETLGELGADKGAQVELDVPVVEQVGGVEVTEEAPENLFEPVLVPRYGELHERVAVEVAEIEVCGCIDLGWRECLEEVVQYLVAVEIDCRVEEVAPCFVVEMRLDEVEVDEELEAFDTVCCALVGHEVLSVDFAVFQIGVSELNGSADDDVISNCLEELPGFVTLGPKMDLVAERFTGGPHHMEGMDAGAGQMRIVCSNEEQLVEHLVEDVSWYGGETEVIDPVVDCMLVRIVIVQTVKAPLGLIWSGDGETECTADENVEEKLLPR